MPIVIITFRYSDVVNLSIMKLEPIMLTKTVTKISSILSGVKWISIIGFKYLGKKFWSVFNDMKNLILTRKLKQKEHSCHTFNKIPSTIKHFSVDSIKSELEKIRLIVFNGFFWLLIFEMFQIWTKYVRLLAC